MRRTEGATDLHTLRARALDRAKIRQLTPAQQQALLRSMQDELQLQPIQPKPLTCVLAPLDEPEPGALKHFLARMGAIASKSLVWVCIGFGLAVVMAMLARG